MITNLFFNNRESMKRDLFTFKKTFAGGIRLPDFKSSTSNLTIEDSSLPQKVILPLLSYGVKSLNAQVMIGEEVKTGQLIATSNEFISAPIYASISGRITEITDLPHPDFGEAKSIVIESDGKDEKGYNLKERDYRSLSSDEIRKIIKDSGIVGLGGASFPTYVKFTIPEDKHIDSFIINLCECEPYLTVDYRIALEMPDEIFKGIEVVLKILNIESAYIAIEDNKQEAIDVLNEKAKAYPQVKVVVLRTKYPQGEEKQLIRAVLKRVVPKGKLPLDVGVVVDNVQTVLAIYEAVLFNKPLYERIITVTGEAIKEPKNLRVRIGTPLHHIIKECGGITSDEVEIIFGGPMMGTAVDNLEVPILAGTSGVLVLPKRKIDLQTESPCIRCGRCVEVCPMRLLPTEINKAVENKQWDFLDELNISECIECGSCAYICPSKIPLVKRIKEGKEVLTKRKVKRNR